MIKLLIEVKPNSFKDEISLDSEKNFTVKIRAKPIGGRANEYLIKYLAKEFGIKRSSIEIEKGAISRAKRVILSIEPIRWNIMINKYK